jgi:hypothetical protein
MNQSGTPYKTVKVTLNTWDQSQCLKWLSQLNASCQASINTLSSAAPTQDFDFDGVVVHNAFVIRVQSWTNTGLSLSNVSTEYFIEAEFYLVPIIAFAPAGAVPAGTNSNTGTPDPSVTNNKVPSGQDLIDMIPIC